MVPMTVIKINALTVPQGPGDELARRFAARAGAVDGQDGFEAFELLRPTDGRDQWLVVTRWPDEACFQSWASSAAFAHGHAGARPARPPRRPGGRRVRTTVLRGGRRAPRWADR
jgi:heme-degrading monooxygenase HmoA